MEETEKVKSSGFAWDSEEWQFIGPSSTRHKPDGLTYTVLDVKGSYSLLLI